MPRKKTITEPLATPTMYDAGMAAILLQGSQTPFWLTLKKIIQDNVDYLTQKVLRDESLSERVEIATKRDLVRKWLELNENLLELPEKLAQSIERGETKPINFDPYKGKLGEQNE